MCIRDSLYRTGVGVVIHAIRNAEAFTFSSVLFKRIVRFSVNRTDLENGKINPRGLNLIPINSSLMIADIDAARNSAIGQMCIRDRSSIVMKQEIRTINALNCLFKRIAS